ncbi:MAG: hypothetical protein IJ205_06315 [Bacteroidales bacterium]|nr:hypothetical protein [Bacteroidales bacterium]
MAIHLEIISPEGKILCQDTDRVELPGVNGRFVVLKDHAPLVSSLVEGEIVFGISEGKDGVVPIFSGFVEVCENHVIACVEV